MKAALPANASAMAGTSSGVTIAPTLAPALKMPMARARSRLRKPFGDGGECGRIGAGFAEAEDDADHREAERSRWTSACAMCAAVHTRIASA